MRNSYLIPFFLLFVTCCHKLNQQSSDNEQSHSFEKPINQHNINHLFSVDSLPGYSIDSEDRTLKFFKGDQQILSAQLIDTNEYSLQQAMQIDSNDISRSFAIYIALNPPLGDADDCHSEYSMDSISSFKNKFDLRCLHIWLTSRTFCTDGTKDSSHYQGFFVDVSQNNNFELIEIPQWLDFSGEKNIETACELLVNNIKRH